MELHSYLSEKHRKRRKRRNYVLFAAVIVALYLLAIVTFWIIFRSPLFRVDAVAVEGDSSVSSDAAVALFQSAALRNYSFIKAVMGFHNILMWPGSLSTSDLAFEPRLLGATISRNYFSHTITIYPRERASAGTWCFVTGDCYAFDDHGFIFKSALDVAGGTVISIHDESQSPRGLGEYVLPAALVPNLISVLHVLEQSSVPVQSVTLHNLALQEVAVQTQTGPTLYFSLHFPSNEDLSVLQTLMAKPGFSKLAYIDFRVENRAYYK